MTVDASGRPLDPAAEMNGAEGRQMVRVSTSWLSVGEASILGLTREDDGCSVLVSVLALDGLLKKIAVAFARRFAGS